VTVTKKIEIMTATDLLNLIWGKAYFEFNSQNSGVIKSKFDFENCHCRICDELLHEYQSKDGILAEYNIQPDAITVILDPDYFYTTYGDYYQDNYIYDKIEDVFNKLNWKHIPRIEIVQAEMECVS
tara:strand:+ start:140622 stop:140999 length:378 start_codon:yes stop_codon:yes gene_type:complete